VLGVVSFEGAVAGAVKMDDDRHNFAEGQARLASSRALAAGDQVPVVGRFKALAEVVDIAEHVKERAHRGFLGLVGGGSHPPSLRKPRFFCKSCFPYPELTLLFTASNGG